MSERFHDKYRIPSARLRNWDYGWNAMYFVTVCTQGRENYFGEIVDGKMILSEIGKISEQEWIKTPEIRPDMNLELDAFVVMPNHFHAIIIIGDNQYNAKLDADHRDAIGNIGRDAIGMIGRDAMHCVSTESRVPTIPDAPIPVTKNKFGPQSKNLASIIRGFKSSVTTNARKIHAGFDWQPRFHEHIIRNDESYQRISEYIQNNPANWHDDKFYNRTEP